MANENMKVSDSLFVELFSDNERFLELYNALSGRHLKLEETKIEDYVIKDTIYRSLKNDVCKLVNGNLVVLVEHQSTVNKNMPLRCLLYVARIYEMLVPVRERYYRGLRKIPKPEFYVLYTGTADIEEYKVLSLSDAFYSSDGEVAGIGNEPPAPSGEFAELDGEFSNSPSNSPLPDIRSPFQLELEVAVLNVKPGKNLKILENCNTLKEYSELIEKIHSLLRENGDREAVYKEAVKWGLRTGILKGYLEQAVAEVLNMLVAEYSYEEDVSAQREEAFEEGVHQKAVETAKKLLDEQIPVETIARCTGLSLEYVSHLSQQK